ncbi:MAG TPA: hypothetical protein PLB63_11690, partial [Planctomycetota bacterium]|nr:hypothetical protein [Planctomycetota bacterium]HQB00476.1 hypothetical protein [Planctomycetota bacterium]
MSSEEKQNNQLSVNNIQTLKRRYTEMMEVVSRKAKEEIKQDSKDSQDTPSNAFNMNQKALDAKNTFLKEKHTFDQLKQEKNIADRPNVLHPTMIRPFTSRRKISEDIFSKATVVQPTITPSIDTQQSGFQKSQSKTHPTPSELRKTIYPLTQQPIQRSMPQSTPQSTPQSMPQSTPQSTPQSMPQSTP